MTPRLSTIHTAIFLVGLLALPFGLVLPRQGVLLVSGVCFAVTGALTIAGHRTTMRGPLGDFLRRVVSGVRLGGAYVVGAGWILFGAFLVVAAVWTMTASEPSPPEAPPPAPPAASGS